MCKGWAALLGLQLALTGCVSLAQAPASADPAIAKMSAHDRILAATNAAGLDAVTAKPWHLTLTVTVLDARAGTSPRTGTVEVWRDGENSRTTFAFGTGKHTSLRAGGKFFRSDSGEPAPDQLPAALSGILRPGPAVEEIEASQPDLRRETMGKTDFDCIMLAQKITRVAYAPLGLFPTYCLIRGTTDLRVRYDFGSEELVINRAGKFLGQAVPVKIGLSRDGKSVASAEVTALSTFVPRPDEFTAAADMIPVGAGTAKVASGVMAGAKTGGPPPTYPASARQAHISGTVVMRAVIGRDGHIHSLRVVQAPDPDLAVSAIAAVRQWTYKPYLLNGEPTEVDTTVIVNYNLNP